MHSQDNDKTIVGGLPLDLVYSIVSEDGKIHELEGGEVIGRGKDCDIFIDDKKISRNHAEFNIKDGRLQITDLKSSNGTFKNGSKLLTEENLSNGDLISFEKHVYSVKIEMAQEKIIQEPIEDTDDDSDYTAVVNMSEEYLAKLSDASKNLNKAPPVLEGVENLTKEVKEKPLATKPAPSAAPKEDVPKSWVEETGAIDGTRMMGAEQLDLLRAGSNEVISNETDISRLHCFIEGQDEEIIELNIGNFTQASGWEIGRDDACDIVLDHGSVSNRHAQIIHQNGRWKMVNLVSTNGIIINGQKKLTTYLSDGDKIGLGSVNLVFKEAKSTQKISKNNVSNTKPKGKFPIVPVLLGLILLVVALVLFMYMQK